MAATASKTTPVMALAALGVLVALAAPGCGFAMYDQRYRPMTLRLKLPNPPTTESPLKLWLIEPELGHRVSGEIDLGRFSEEDLGPPSNVTVEASGWAEATMDAYTIRVCTFRCLLLPHFDMSKPRQYIMAILQLANNAYDVYEIAGRRLSTYRTIQKIGPSFRVIATMTGHSWFQSERNRERDVISVQLKDTWRKDD